MNIEFDIAICKEVILCNLSRKGKGIPGSPFRAILQVFDKDGTLIAENDPSGQYSQEDLVDFAWSLRRNGSLQPLDAFENWIKEKNLSHAHP